MLNKVTSVSQIAPGLTVSVNFPVNGKTYNFATWALTNVTPADMTNIKFKLNGKTFQEFDDGTVLDELNDYYNRPYSGANHTAFFERPELREQFRRLTSIGTMGLSTFTMEFNLAATVVDPAIQFYADTGEPQLTGMITKIKKFPVSFTSAGKHDIDKIPRVGKIAALHFYKSDISNVIIERDDVLVVDATKDILEQVQKIYDRVPVTAKCTHVDFIHRGVPTEALEVISYKNNKGQGIQKVQDLRARLELDSAGQVIMLVEYLDSMSGL